MPGPYTFEFRLSAADLSRSMHTLADLPAGEILARAARRQWLRTLPIVVVGAFFAPIGVLSIISVTVGVIAPGLIVVIGAGGAALVLAMYLPPILSKENMRRQVEAMIDQQILIVPGIIGPVSITINEAGVTYDAIATSVWIAWAGVSDLHETEEFLLVESIQRRLLVLPKTVVNEQAPVAEVVAMMRGCMEAAGGRATLVDAFMETSKLMCPVCEYPIGPASVHRCPECGRDIEIEDLRAAQ